MIDDAVGNITYRAFFRQPGKHDAVPGSEDNFAPLEVESRARSSIRPTEGDLSDPLMRKRTTREISRRCAADKRGSEKETNRQEAVIICDAGG